MERTGYKIEGIKFGFGAESRGKIFLPEAASNFPAVLFFHGYESGMSNYEEIAAEMAGMSIAAMVFDSRVYSRKALSSVKYSKWSYDPFLEAKEAMEEFTSLRGLDKSRIGVLGGSMGGYLAACITDRYPGQIKSLVLRAPASAFWLDGSVDGPDCLEAIGGFRGNLLVIQGENDHVTPAKHTTKYFESAVNAADRRIHVIKGAGHTYGTSGPQYNEFKKTVVNWFVETLS